MKIYFVRHGQSEDNLSDILEQRTEGPLSEHGRKQADFVAKRFDTIPVDIIVSSTLARTKETTAIINTSLHKEVLYSNLLVECRFPSSISGRSHHDEDIKELVQQLRSNYHLPEVRHSDEETFPDMVDRAKKALEYISNLPYESVLVVTHGMFLRVLVAYMIFGDNLTAHEFTQLMYTLKTKNTGITYAEYFKDSTTDTNRPGNKKWRIHTWNDHAHLGEVV